MHNTPSPAHRRATVYLLLLGAGMAATYAAALQRFPLLNIYAQSLQNLDKLTLSDWRAGLALSACIALLFGSYALGTRLIQTAARPPRFTLIAGVPLIFIALLLFVYPTTSIDLYDYLFRGRMLAHYEANTFVAVPQDFSSDGLFQFIAWRRSVTAYGPMWEWMSWLTARLAGDAPDSMLQPTQILLRLLLAYKLLATLGFLLCGAAIWLALGRSAPHHRALGLYLWLWNPLALWELVAAGHNDAWMALPIVVALALLHPKSKQRGSGSSEPATLAYALAAFLTLTVGGLIKYLALIFGPLLLAAALRRQANRRDRARLLVAGGVACVALVIAAYAHFWVGTATLRQFSDRGTLFTASWLAALQALLVQWIDKGVAQSGVALGGLALLLAGIAWSAWRAWRDPNAVTQHALWLLLWFLFVCNTWFQPWYLLWALALVALQPWRPRVVAMMTVFCATGLLSYIPGPFLLPLIASSTAGWADSAAWNALLTLLIYVPPLVALGWGQWPLRPARRTSRFATGSPAQELS